MQTIIIRNCLDEVHILIIIGAPVFKDVCTGSNNWWGGTMSLNAHLSWLLEWIYYKNVQSNTWH